MRKLAILGIILLIVIVVLVCMAVWNVYGFRDTAYNGIQGTVLQPIHDWSIATWIQIGDLGFTYIAATFLGIAIGGGLFLVFIAYGLFWQKLIQGKILHKTVETAVPLASMQRTTSTNLTPTAQEVKPSETLKEEEKQA